MFGKKRVRGTYNCSFCNKNQDQVQRLIAGPGGVYICDECIDLLNGQNNAERAGQGAVANTHGTQVAASCSFCGKKQKQVQRLVVGPHQVCICNECLDLCREIIDEEKI